ANTASTSNTIVDANVYASIDDATNVDATGNKDTFTVYLNAPAPVDETINYAVHDGTAVQGTDYDASGLTGSVTIKRGQTTATIAVPLVVNMAGTDAAQFSVQLTSASMGVRLMRDTGTGTVIYPNSVPALDPIFYIGDTSGFQDTNNTVTFTFTIYTNIATT